LSELQARQVQKRMQNTTPNNSTQPESPENGLGDVPAGEPKESGEIKDPEAGGENNKPKEGDTNND
jgi:hypothetical protein